MQNNRLVVAHVSPPFTMTGEESWIKTPGNHRIDDRIVVAVDIHLFGGNEELSFASGVSCSMSSQS